MFDTASVHVTHETILKEYSVSLASKLNKHALLFGAMKTYWSVLEYATLAINLSLLQHSHVKPDTRQKMTDFMGEKQTHIRPSSTKSARSRHYYLATPARLRHYHLASDHKIMEWTVDRYISANQYPRNPLCVQESVVGPRLAHGCCMSTNYIIIISEQVFVQTYEDIIWLVFFFGVRV